MGDRRAVNGELIGDTGLSLDTDSGLSANSDLKIPSQKAVKGYVDGNGLLSNGVARVDPSGNDSNGVVGDISKPFLTVQGAIDAIEAGSFAEPLIEVGPGLDLREDPTTTLDYIQFRSGAGGGSTSFQSLTFSGDSPNGVSIILQNIQAGSITAANSSFLSIDFYSASVNGDITNSLLGELDLNGHGTSLIFGGTIANVGGDIRLSGFGFFNNSITINSAGSAITAKQSRIAEVTAAASISLSDSRVLGTNGASSTTYADVLMNSLGAFAKLVPTADPPGSPAEGMVYADTDHHLYYYNGTTWKQLDN